MRTANILVNVTANTPPTLGNYANLGPINLGAGAMVTPNAPPADNVAIASASASASNFSGTFSVDPVTGKVTISDAGPAGTYTVNVKVTDNCGEMTVKSFQLIINGPPSVTAAIGLSRQQGSPASNSTIATVGDDLTVAGNLTVSLVSAPPGLSVTNLVNSGGTVTANLAANCVLATGPQLFTIKATDAGGLETTATVSVNITANSAPTLGSYGTTNVTTGSSGTVVTPNAVPNDNGTVVSLTASAPNFTGTFIGDPVTGKVTINNATPTGGFTVTVTATDTCGTTNTATFQLLVSCPNIVVQPVGGSVPTVLAAATVGTNYSQTFTQTGGVGNVSFSRSAGTLPAGLTLSSAGLLSGSPTTAGTSIFTVRATDQNGCTGEREYTLTIDCPIITLAALPNAIAGSLFNATLSASPAGGNYQYSSTDKPGWLTLASNGALSGTPPSAGTYTFNVNVTGVGICTKTLSVTLTVNCPAITMTPATLPNSVLGMAYSQTLAAGPAGGNYSYAVTTGALPAGLTLNSTSGAITGTPTASGNYAFGVTTTGWGACAKTQSYNLLVTGTCATVTVNPGTLPAGTFGVAYTQTLTATVAGSAVAASFSVTQGASPPGLLLDGSSGALTGTPTAGGTYSFRLTATAAGGCTGSRSYVMSVACVPFSFVPNVLPGGLRGAAYSQQLSVGSPATFGLLLGSLPAGFNLSSTGLLSGTTTQTGTYNFTIKAQAGACQGTKAYALVIGAGNAALALSGDYDGDGKADPALWSAKDGIWRISRSSDGQTSNQSWGTAGDITLLGDYDGDGKSDLAVFRPSDATFYVKRSSDGKIFSKAWGLATDVPMPGDYDGDGKTDLMVFRPSEGNWYVLHSANGQASVTAWGGGYAPYHDVPVAGDYDGDGKSDVAVFRRGNGNWLIKGSRAGQTIVKFWGVGTDVPVAYDYDGDGLTDLAVWRPAEGNWYVWQSGTNSYRVTLWGMASDQTSAADYDGDGQADLAVWRTNEAQWYINCSHDKSVRLQALGSHGDTPVSRNP